MILVLALVVAGIGFWAGQRQSQSIVSPASPAVTRPTLTATPTIVSDGLSASPATATNAPNELILLDQSKTSDEIVNYNLATHTRTVLFTDKDEPVKIKQITNLTADGNEVLAVVGKPNADTSGSLWAIALDGSGKTTPLIDRFNSPWPPAVSPDGSLLAYVDFSNAEIDGGYQLIVAHRDGSQPRTVVTASSAMTQPIFSHDGQSIDYVQDKAPSGAVIMNVNITSKKSKSIATFTDRVPYDLAVGADGNLVFIDGTGSQTGLYQLTAGQTDPVKLTVPSGQASHPIYDAQASTLAFTAASAGKSEIYSYTIQTAEYQPVTAGTLVIGWR